MKGIQRCGHDFTVDPRLAAAAAAVAVAVVVAAAAAVAVAVQVQAAKALPAPVESREPEQAQHRQAAGALVLALTSTTTWPSTWQVTGTSVNALVVVGGRGDVNMVAMMAWHDSSMQGAQEEEPQSLLHAVMKQKKRKMRMTAAQMRGQIKMEPGQAF